MPKNRFLENQDRVIGQTFQLLKFVYHRLTHKSIKIVDDNFYYSIKMINCRKFFHFDVEGIELAEEGNRYFDSWIYYQENRNRWKTLSVVVVVWFSKLQNWKAAVSVALVSKYNNDVVEYCVKVCATLSVFSEHRLNPTVCCMGLPLPS